ncbi:hypothetical protein CTS44_16383 [Comamonas thiooxydans]|nr:hypothetical protein CTS44_16383 [Comamonas thiooxydans]
MVCYIKIIAYVFIEFEKIPFSLMSFIFRRTKILNTSANISIGS